MGKKKLLLITFDYELFLGERSGSAQECLISPTDIIMESLKKFDLKAYFFVDTVYILKLKEEALKHSLAKADLDRITTQLIKNNRKRTRDISAYSSALDGCHIRSRNQSMVPE